MQIRGFDMCRTGAVLLRSGFGLLLAAICSIALAANPSLPAPLQRVVSGHKIPTDSISIVVQEIGQSSPLLTLNPDVARNPASAIKLVTTWGALDLLGANHTWRTRVFADGPINDGVLNGNLYLKGYGDPYLVLEEFWKLVGELRRSGLRHINGDIVIDQSHFAPDATDAGAFDGARYRLYNVKPSALMVNFKALHFDFAGQAGKKINVVASPNLPNLKITSRVKATQGSCRRQSPKIIMNVADPKKADQVEFSGSLPAQCRNYRLARTALTASSYAYGTFHWLWEQWGGTLSGTMREAITPKTLTPLLTWNSRPLSEVIRPLNKWSNNTMTRMLLLSLGALDHSPPLSRQQGIAVLRNHLEQRGLDTTELVIDNGAGLSRDTRVSAKFMTDLLGLAWQQPTMPEFVASMAVAGQDGTVRRRFRGKPQAGQMHLKTGRLNNVVAIAGYVHADSGKHFAVCLLVNHKNVHYGPGTELQNALLDWAWHQ